MASTINFIGCGKAGKTLGRLWCETGGFIVGDILTQSLDSARLACQRVGAGRAIDDLSEMTPADIYLIATSDQQIGEMAAQLAATELLTESSVTFHLSGALESACLRVDKTGPGKFASVHPILSFAGSTTLNDFAGTWCGFEGDASAKSMLVAGFESIGGRCFDIQPGSKLLYHAASVMTSNYVNALVDASIQCYALAGIDRRLSKRLIAPILEKTVKNIINDGPQTTLTGPIARGDWEIISREIEALTLADPKLAEVYQVMCEATQRLLTEEPLTD